MPDPLSASCLVPRHRAADGPFRPCARPRTAARLPLIIALGLGLASAPLPYARAVEPVANLDEVRIKGQSLSAAAGGQAAYSVTRMDEQEIREAQVSRVQSLFQNVPGMNLTSYGLPGVADAVSLRGFGGGGHGGDVGFVLDGIPLNEAMSHADGYADLDVVVPLEVAGMTVLRGPVSALYSNYHRAGTVTLETRRGGSYREADLRIGSFRTVDLQAAAGFVPDTRQSINIAAQAFRSDGFRPQSAGDRQTLAGRWTLAATPDLGISVSGRTHRAAAHNAGYLTAAQFAVDPYGVDRRMQNDGSKKQFHTLRLDIDRRLGPDLKLLSFVYGTRQDFTRWFTRGGAAAATWSQREESYERGVFGAGFSLNGRHRPADRTLDWVAGIETYRERTDYLKYEGTDFRRRVGSAEYDRRFTLDNVAAFAEASWALHPWFNPTLGLRWDRFNGQCSVQGVETAGDACGSLAAVSQTSPKLGIRSVWDARFETRVSLSQGFALATEMAKYALGSSVAPNVFRQLEIGARVKPISGLTLDLALYRLRSSDEIVESAPATYENAGATRRTGVELSTLWAPAASFDMSLVLGSAHSRIEQNPDATLIGRRVPNVPRTTTTLTANWRPVAGWQGTLVWRKVGEYAVNGANTLSYGGYHRVDLAVAYTLRPAVLAGRPLTVHVAVDNLSDRAYATSVSTVGYAPGAPRMLRIGAQMSL